MQESKKRSYNNPVSATLTGITDLFRRREPSGILTDKHRLDGKTVLIDGASSGLGFATAVEVAKRGARVIMACRTGIPEKGELAKKLSGSSDIFMEHVDLAVSSSIQDLAGRLKKYPPIDIYICNAGIVPKKSRMTSDGFEEMFMVNYLSKYLFIRLLINEDLFGDLPRIIIVSSESHRNPEAIEWENFGKFEDFTIGKSVERYGYNKLLLTTFSHELSKRLNQYRKFPVLVLCPGPINSNIAREAPGIFIPLLKLVFGIFFRSPARACIPVVYLAAATEEADKSFDYFFIMTRKEVDEKASDPENGKRLWDLSEEILKTRHIL